MDTHQVPPPAETHPSYCWNCGAELAEGGGFCHKCGAQAAAHDGVAGGARTQSAEYRRTYPLGRIGLLILVSFGAYYAYWLGVSWKHMSAQTRGRDHYPFWHVMVMAVPIYGQYVLYHHFRTMKELQSEAGVTSNLSPGWIVVINVAGYLAAFSDSFFFGMDLSYVAFLAILAFVANGLWGQANLNRYWGKVSEGLDRPAR